MTTETDTTQELENALDKWSKFANGDKARTEEVAELLTYAGSAKTAQPWMWGELTVVLTEHTNLSKNDVAREVRRARVLSDLGSFPHSVAEFVPLWLAARGLTMTFSRMFERPGETIDYDVVYNQMLVWCHEHDLFKRTFEAALKVWMADEQKRVAARAYQRVAHDPSIDPEKGELRKFLALILDETGDDEADERNTRAAMATFANFIHRVKNHTAAYAGIKRPDGAPRWTHHSHLMPVLYGPQGTGKTTALNMLLAPMAGFHAGMGFDMLNHDAKLYRLSELPIMRFDEMAGASKADVQVLKNIMTEETRDLRKLYANSSERYLVSTFVGASNQDISGLIRDETGNRRFIQFGTKKADISALKAIDVSKIWRSIDENAVAPMYAASSDLEAITDIQSTQRHLSLVEEWLEDADDLPIDERKATDIFRIYFKDWLEDHAPGQTKTWSAGRLARELTRLARAGDPRIEARTVANSNSYTIRKAADVVLFRRAS